MSHCEQNQCINRQSEQNHKHHHGETPNADRGWAIVTGAVGGIGTAICEELAKNRFNLVLAVRKIDERSDALKAKLEGYGAQTMVIAADVSDYDECERLVKEVSGQTGRIDALINNAGITKDNLVRMSPQDFRDVIDTNLNSAFYLSKCVFPVMMKARKGRIVNITSYVGLHGNAGQANYSAAKAGMIGLTKATAREFASRGVLVNAVAPGFIESPMTDVLSDKVKESIFAQIPLQRLGVAQNIADMVHFLVSDRASYITGQCFSVDGGMSI
ncbi:MAG: 3-oxoacyl-[acyl-carrier-protein] reductase [Bacillota bacterium]|nr:3-oxoacyl-[acyl-carrier-protein] reductase [Bacillota bacterium]